MVETLPKQSRAEYFRQYRLKQKEKEKAGDVVLVAAEPELVAQQPEHTATAHIIDGKVSFRPAKDPPIVEFKSDQQSQTGKIEGSEGQDGHQERGEAEAQEENSGIDVLRPPRRLPTRTKQHWSAIPIPIREDIILREQEFDSAISKYAGLGKYLIEAERNGTTLVAALESYRQLETSVRQNPTEGVAQLLGVLRIDVATVVAALADKYLSDGPANFYEAGRQAGYQEGHAAGKLAQFASDKPDFEVLGPKMAAIAAAEPNMPLEQLYETAKWAEPTTRVIEMNKFQRPQQPRFADPMARSRNAAKATISSRSSEPKPKSQYEGDGSYLDDVKRAYHKAKGD